MQHKRILPALIAVVALTAPTAANAREHVTFNEAHTAVHYVLDTYAEATDGHLTVGACARRGTRSVVCRARITGPVSGRYRIVVTGWYGNPGSEDGYVLTRVRTR